MTLVVDASVAVRWLFDMDGVAQADALLQSGRKVAARERLHDLLPELLALRGPQLRRESVFARGFDHPLALTVDKQNRLLVADWGRGVIYRIQSRGG